MGSFRNQGGGSHLTFEKMPLEAGAKLHKYKVINSASYDYIGFVHWRGGWMQYVFQAFEGVDMSRSCHLEINAFIDKLMQEWREARKGV